MFKKFFKIFNFWKFPIEFIQEIREWIIVNKALKEPETIKALKECKLEKPSELRVNKIGEIYTIINVPEDIYMSQTGIWPYVMEKMNIVNETMIKCRLSDLVYPSIQHKQGTHSWLLVLAPKRDYIRPGRILLEIIRWIFSIFLVLIIFRILGHYNIDVFSEIGKVFNHLK